MALRMCSAGKKVIAVKEDESGGSCSMLELCLLLRGEEM
jgi:hypothetical protein